MEPVRDEYVKVDQAEDPENSTDGAPCDCKRWQPLRPGRSGVRLGRRGK